MQLTKLFDHLVDDTVNCYASQPLNWLALEVVGM